MPKSANPETAMRRAIALSKRGYPAPNPHVGCVLVRDGLIVGEGFHGFAGGPHAEVVALSNAGGLAKGSTAYVTLEPCAHHGRTPPCVDALIGAGVSKVVIATRDPNPKAAGGAERLRKNGIEVEIGILSTQASWVNRRWLRAMELGRPYVVAKLATSVDGRIALPSGESKWITEDRARSEARKLRAEMGAVLVGAGTILADDPQLTCRIRGIKNQPVRVILDGHGRLSGSERAFREPGESLWFTSEQKPGSIQLQSQRAIFEPRIVLSELWNRGLRGVLIEGGPATISQFLSAGLVDEFQIFVGAVALGSGFNALSFDVENLSDAPRFELESVRKLGNDGRLIYCARH